MEIKDLSIIQNYSKAGKGAIALRTMKGYILDRMAINHFSTISADEASGKCDWRHGAVELKPISSPTVINGSSVLYTEKSGDYTDLKFKNYSHDAYVIKNGSMAVFSNAGFSSYPGLIHRYAGEYIDAVGVCTISIGTPCIITKSSHGLITGDCIYFSTTGSLPTGITVGKYYFVILVSENIFNIAESYEDCINGISINTSGSQSGTHQIPEKYKITAAISGLEAGDVLLISATTNRTPRIHPSNQAYSGIKIVKNESSGIYLINEIYPDPGNTLNEKCQCAMSIFRIESITDLIIGLQFYGNTFALYKGVSYYNTILTAEVVGKYS